MRKGLRLLAWEAQKSTLFRDNMSLFHKKSSPLRLGHRDALRCRLRLGVIVYVQIREHRSRIKICRGLDIWDMGPGTRHHNLPEGSSWLSLGGMCGQRSASCLIPAAASKKIGNGSNKITLPSDHSKKELFQATINKATVICCSLSHTRETSIRQNLHPDCNTLDKVAREAESDCWTLWANYPNTSARLLIDDTRQIQPQVETNTNTACALRLNRFARQLGLSLMASMQSAGLRAPIW